MFGKISAFGAVLALLTTLTAGSAVRAAGNAPSCCATKTRCCDQVKYCCDQPEKATCCLTGTPCCDAKECCGTHGKTARVTKTRKLVAATRAQCCSVKAASAAPSRRVGTDMSGQNNR